MPSLLSPTAAFVPTLDCPAEHVIKFQSAHVASANAVQQAAVISESACGDATRLVGFFRSKNLSALPALQPDPIT